MPHASHLSHVVEVKRRKVAVQFVLNEIKSRKLQFDTIAVCGVSGLGIGPIVAFKLGKSLCVVRKGEKAHSPYKVESEGTMGQYIIIDDLIDSGTTVRKIIKAVREDANKYGHNVRTCVGALLYDTQDTYIGEELQKELKDRAARCR